MRKLGWIVLAGVLSGSAVAQDAPTRILGSVTTEKGDAVAGARIACDHGTAATTGADGSYALEAASAIVHLLSVTTDGYARVQKVIPTHGRTASELRVDFVVRRRAPLVGRVVDQEGRPVLGAQLSAKLAADDSVYLYDVETDAEGAFRLEDAHAGSWWLSLCVPFEGDWGGARGILVSPADGPLQLALQRGEGRTDLVVDLVDSATGQPLAAPENALIHRVDDFGRKPVRDVEVELGRMVARGLGAGRWELEFRTQFGPAVRHFGIAPGTAEVRRRIEVGPRGAIVGSIESGSVVPPGVLVLFADQHVRVAKPATEFDGRAFLGSEDGFAFRLEEVPSGVPVVLRAQGRDIQGRASVTVSPGGEGTVVIRARRTGNLELRLMNPPRVQPIMVDLLPENEPDWEDHFRVAPDDPCVVRAVVPDGPVRWTVRWPDPKDGRQVSREGKATVQAGSTTSVDIDVR